MIRPVEPTIDFYGPGPLFAGRVVARPELLQRYWPAALHAREAAAFEAIEACGPFSRHRLPSAAPTQASVRLNWVTSADASPWAVHVGLINARPSEFACVRHALRYHAALPSLWLQAGWPVAIVALVCVVATCGRRISAPPRRAPRTGTSAADHAQSIELSTLQAARTFEEELEQGLWDGGDSYESELPAYSREAPDVSDDSADPSSPSSTEELNVYGEL